MPSFTAFRRLQETHRSKVTFSFDGAPVDAMEGDTVLTAVLLSGGRIRESEFGDGPRAGFCLMAACQDCWVWNSAGSRVRACSTLVAGGLELFSQRPGAFP